MGLMRHLEGIHASLLLESEEAQPRRTTSILLHDDGVIFGGQIDNDM